MQANNGSNNERFRLAMSDGQQWMSGMLATQLNELVKSKQIGIGVMLRVDEFITNDLQGKRCALTAAAVAALRCDTLFTFHSLLRWQCSLPALSIPHVRLDRLPRPAYAAVLHL